jgi:hypothetical protein
VQQRTDRYRAAWRRWRAFARKAAEVQSEIVLGALFVAVVPFAAARRLAGRAPAWKTGWQRRAVKPDELQAARRQF